MNITLLKVLGALVPAGALFSGSLISFSRKMRMNSFLQLVGAGCLVLVVLTHVFEALHLLPSMGWGSERSLGHYIDLVAAGLGITLFPAGYLLQAVSQKQS